MEFRFDLQQIFKPGPDGVAILGTRQTFLKRNEVNQVIDRMGEASARAQGLRSTITTANRFFSSSDSKIYLKIEKNKAIGFLKIGYRRLFHSDHIGRIKELNPLCLLDFYVHEDMQRHGFGKEIYEIMLKEERITPNRIAIDRPSSKLLNFMRKYYKLADFIPQNNNFVIYREFFSPHYSVEECLKTEHVIEDNPKPRAPSNARQTRSNANPFMRTTNASYGEECHQHQGQSSEARERKLIELASDGVAHDHPATIEQSIKTITGHHQKPFTPVAPPWAVSDSTRRLNANTTSSSYGYFLGSNK